MCVLKFHRCLRKWGFRWCLRRWRMRNRLPKNLARMQFGRLGDCSACRLAISGRTSPANGSRFPRISGVLSTQTVSLHKCAPFPRSANDFAKQSLVSTPCGCLGVSGLAPDVHPLIRQCPTQEAQCSRHLTQTNGPHRGGLFMPGRSVSRAPGRQTDVLRLSKPKTVAMITMRANIINYRK